MMINTNATEPSAKAPAEMAESTKIRKRHKGSVSRGISSHHAAQLADDVVHVFLPEAHKTLYIAGFSGIYKVLVVIEGTTH